MEAEVPTKFVQEPSSHLKCPVCQQLYRDPVINTKCGHTFCRACAFAATRCPVDGSHCDTSQLVVNRLVVGQVEDLQVYCQHGLVKDDSEGWILQPDLCPEIVPYTQRSDHEAKCPFALVPCPNNSSLCGSWRRRDLEKHQKECLCLPCAWHKKGCEFLGSQSQVADHSKQCPFQDSGNVNGHLNVRLKKQEQLVVSLQSDNAKLITRVSELEKSNGQLVAQMDKQTSLLHSLQQNLESLTNRLDQLTSGSVVIRRPVSTGSHLSLAEGAGFSMGSGYHRTGSVSSSRQGSPGRTHERWEMPFQFKCIGTLRGHKDVVWSLTSKKGHLFSAGSEGLIKVWSLDQLAKGCVGNIQAHKGVIHCMATWGNTLITAGNDMAVCLWDVDTYEQKGIIKDAHDNIICSLVVHEDLVFTASYSFIKVWDLKTVSLKHVMPGSGHWVRTLAISKNKDKLYSGSHNAIHVWETKDNFDRLATIEHEAGSVYCLAITRQYIIAGNSGSYNNNLQLFTADTHQFVMSLCGHLGTVTTVVTSPSGRFLFSASQDNNIQMWGLEKLLPIQTLSRHQGSVNTLTLHGDYLLSGSEDHEIKVFRYFQIQ